MLRIIFYTILVVLILSFFGISLQSIVHSPAGESNFAYLGDILATILSFIVNSVVSAYHWLAGLIM